MTDDLTQTREGVTSELQAPPSNVLGTCVEGDVRVTFELTGEQRRRLEDAGAGALTEHYYSRVKATARGLGRIVAQQVEPLEGLRERLCDWLAELDGEDPGGADEGTEDEDE